MLNALYRSTRAATLPYVTPRVTPSHELHASIRCIIALFALGLYVTSGWFTLDLLKQFAHTEADLWRYIFLGMAFEVCKCLFLSAGAVFITRKLKGGWPLFSLGIVLMVFSVVASMGSINVASDQSQKAALHAATGYQARQVAITSLQDSIAVTRQTQAAQIAAHQVSKSALTAKQIEKMETKLAALVDTLDNTKAVTSPSHSFFGGLQKLFGLIGLNWQEEHIKVVAELATAILMELLAIGLTFLGGIKCKVRIITEPDDHHPTPFSAGASDTASSLPGGKKSNTAKPSISLVKSCAAANDAMFDAPYAVPVQVQKSAPEQVHTTAKPKRKAANPRKRSKGSADTGLVEGINYRFEQYVLPLVQAGVVKPSIRALKRWFKCGQGTAETYLAGLTERHIITWDDAKHRHTVVPLQAVG